MSISTDQNYAGFKRFPAGTMPVEYIFPHYLYNNIVLSMLYAEICPRLEGIMHDPNCYYYSECLW